MEEFFTCDNCGYKNSTKIQECVNCHKDLSQVDQHLDMEGVSRQEGKTKSDNSDSRSSKGNPVLISGVILLALGIIISFVSYSNTVQNAASSYSIYWGLIILGVLLLIKGLANNNSSADNA